MRTAVVIVVALAGLLFAHLANAQPPLPAAFYGTVVIDGKPVRDGTEVKALIDGVNCTQDNNGAPPSTITDGGVSVYAILVVSAAVKPGCGAEGKEIAFTVGGRQAVQTARWKDSFANPAQQINLSIGEGLPVPLPTATAMPTVNPAQAAATATERAAFTPLPGATSLPTDTLTITTGRTAAPPGQFGAAGSGGVVSPTPAATAPSSDSGFSVLGAVLIVLGVVVLTGAAAGYALSRRTRKAAPGDGNA